MAIIIERLSPNQMLRVQATGCQARLFAKDDMAGAEAEAKRLMGIFPKEPMFYVGVRLAPNLNATRVA